MSGRRYFLCDPSLKSYSGHCFEYFRPLISLLRARRDEVVVVGHMAAEPDLVTDTGTLRLFGYWTDEQNVGQPTGHSKEQNYELIRAAHEQQIQLDLASLDNQFAFRQTDILVINTIRHWAIRGIVAWIEELPPSRRPSVILILHFTGLPEPHEYDPAWQHYREAFARIKSSKAADSISLLADSEPLVEEYRNLTDLPIKVAPIPHPQNEIAPPNAGRDGGKLRVGYVGEARLHKGFHLLPYVVKRIEKEYDHVEFLIHTFCFNPHQEFYKAALAQLNTCSTVTPCPTVLTPSEYTKFLNRIDLFLVPYALSNYYRQTSGIYTEAMALGKPVIVSRGTWMARQVNQFGGGSLCIADDHLSLYLALRQVIEHYDRFKRQAEFARRQWNEFHNPERLLKLVDNSASK